MAISELSLLRLAATGGFPAGHAFQACSVAYHGQLSATGTGIALETHRFRQFGFNDAFAVFRDRELAHIAWLISAEHDRVLQDRNVKLRAGEAEITHCLTLPEFRGQGLYPFAIRSLCQVAKERGIQRVFMITNVHNKASQRGIEKAGFTQCGKIVRSVFSFLPEGAAVTYRGHRWH